MLVLIKNFFFTSRQHDIETEKMREDFKQLCPRHRRLIEAYKNFKQGKRLSESENALVKEIREGKISFAFEEMEKFPWSLVDILRHDITHLDLTSNKIMNFQFLRGFYNLKSLIVDNSPLIETGSLPTMEKLELFYANRCKIQFPRTFVNRVAIIFPQIKYFSMIYNPKIKREKQNHIWIRQEHCFRMFVIFMNRNLIHFNDRVISNDERDHSRFYHMYLGPIDCKPSKFKTLPDTEDIGRILPINIQDETEEHTAMLVRDEEDRYDEALSTVSISNYFSKTTAKFRTFFLADKPTASTTARNLQVSPSPSEQFM